MSVNSYQIQRHRLNPIIQSSGSSGSSGGSGGGGGSGEESGILNEKILLKVVELLKWDIGVVGRLASVCWKLRALAKRLLWKGVCYHRAPRIATLADDDSLRRISVEWYALAKVLFFCCGCPANSGHFQVTQTFPGHLLTESRFSKTSGLSFLIKKCRDDVLYVSDPCEHPSMGSDHSEEDVVGIFRGVFTGFSKSRTRAHLIRINAKLEEFVRCLYCGCRMWSMTEARLVPMSAAQRLGCVDGRLEYFVCVNGHLHGSCWLVPLSSDADTGDSN